MNKFCNDFLNELKVDSQHWIFIIELYSVKSGGITRRIIFKKLFFYFFNFFKFMILFFNCQIGIMILRNSDMKKRKSWFFHFFKVYDSLSWKKENLWFIPERTRRWVRPGPVIWWWFSSWRHQLSVHSSAPSQTQARHLWCLLYLSSQNPTPKINYICHWLTDWLIDWHIDWLNDDWMTEWIIDSLII